MGESYKFGYWGKTSEEILKSQFPLHRCCRDGDVEALTALLSLEENKYRIYAEDSFYGWTPAHWAAYFGKLGCLRRLLSGHMDGHVATSRFKQTPSHVAAYGGHPSLLQWLLQSGARTEDKDYLGETALHKAARTGSMECVTLLVAHGADLSVTNNNHHTANQLAKACGYYECTRYLNDVIEQRQRQHTMTSPTVNDVADDCDMDCVDSSLATINYGAGDAPSHHGNGFHGNGEDDILLLEGVGRNHVAVAGKKRAREDAGDEDNKRIRTGDEDAEAAHSSHMGIPQTGENPDYISEIPEMEIDHVYQRREDVLFAIGACMSPSSSVLSVPTQAMERNHQDRQDRQTTSRRPCVFAV